MAKLRIRNPPKTFLVSLEKAGIFQEVKHFPELGMIKARLGGKHILAFASGEISIRAADDREDVLKTVELILKTISEKS